MLAAKAELRYQPPPNVPLAYSTLDQKLLVPSRCCDHHTVSDRPVGAPEDSREPSIEVLAAKAELVGWLGVRTVRLCELGQPLVTI